VRKRRLLLLAIAASVLALAMFSAACEDDEEDGGNGGNGAQPTSTVSEGQTPQAGATVDVNLTEYIVSPDPTSASAGSVTFNASNIGGTDHELVVIKTDLAPDALPTADNGSVDEAGAGIEVLDEIDQFAPGGEESLTLDLEAGNYVLICNVVQERADGSIVAHYTPGEGQDGMAAAFEVTE